MERLITEQCAKSFGLTVSEIHDTTVAFLKPTGGKIIVTKTATGYSVYGIAFDRAEDSNAPYHAENNDALYWTVQFAAHCR